MSAFTEARRSAPAIIYWPQVGPLQLFIVITRSRVWMCWLARETTQLGIRPEFYRQPDCYVHSKVCVAKALTSVTA